MSANGEILPAAAAAALDRLRRRAPRVHCVTNAVAQAFTANVLLALGAVPSMTIAPEEVPDFTQRADALLVNLGTLDPIRRSAATAAIEMAKEVGRPWVLDPVFVEVSQPRLAFAQDLAARGPTAIRLNAAEFAALADRQPSVEAVADYALSRLAVVALTGPSDLVTDGVHHALIDNGHPLMTKVTAAGCAGSAVIAAFLAVEPNVTDAVVAGLAAMGLAAERAGAEARGPGSFAVALLDALAGLTPEDLERGARVR